MPTSRMIRLYPSCFQTDRMITATSAICGSLSHATLEIPKIPSAELRIPWS